MLNKKHCLALHCMKTCQSLLISWQLSVKWAFVQEGLLAEATAFRDANIVDVTSYDELKQAIEEGKWARGPWAGA